MIQFSPAQGDWKAFSGEDEEVRYEVIGSWDSDSKTRILVGAETTLDKLPLVTSENTVVVPQDERRRTEAVLENAANLIAVATGARRKISSPSPCVAFRPDSESEAEWLKGKSGIEEGVAHRSLLWGDLPVELDQDTMSALQDRKDGVALLAEALAHSHPTGQFHEYLRLFERGFRRSSNGLVLPLSSFLADAPGSFDENEIKDWVVRKRHLATHADNRSEFALESEIRPLVARMQIAAFDVLLNKQSWRDPSWVRRKTWMPALVTNGPATDQIYMSGRKGRRMVAQLLDQFGAYPIDLSARLSNLYSDCWPSTFPRLDRVKNS